MFRELRRKNQCLSPEECIRILQETSYGVMALQGDDGYPYIVPLNHACMDGKLYFHGAVQGHKIDAIACCDKASYCVIDASDVDRENYSTRYRSVIAFGRVRVVQEDERKLHALRAIGDKFCPDTPEKTGAEIRGAIAHTAVLEFSMEHISGKESRALAEERRAGK